jgi:GDPmannose 4,6-dehydratase
LQQKTALLTGVTGQDGAYLARLLLEKGYRVVGTVRGTSAISTWRLRELGIVDDIELLPMELTEDSNIRAVLESIRPDEVYNLAGQSFVGDSVRQPIYTSEVVGIGALRLLECVRTIIPDARFYQASSSEMFGNAEQFPQSENTPFHPRNPYGTAKLFAHWAVVNYRQAFGLHCCSGILFNHESPLRGAEFLTRKVSVGLARYALDRDAPLRVGNLDARRDWGHARDYVGAMWTMLQQPTPADFVVATGVTHTVRDFIGFAANASGIRLDWLGEETGERAIDCATGKTVVSVDPTFYRPAETTLLTGDASRARRDLDWCPTVRLEQLAEEMVEADRRRMSGDHLSGLDPHGD